MPVSHRHHHFDDARVECDRWLVPPGTIRRTELRGVEQDERLIFETIAPPTENASRGKICVLLAGEVRAMVEGRERVLRAGSLVAVGQRDRFVAHGGAALTLELDWAIHASSRGEGKIGARALEALRPVADALRLAQQANDFAPHVTTLATVLASEGVVLDGLLEAASQEEEPAEQQYLSMIDRVLSNLQGSPMARDWEDASGTTRRTLTRRTQAFHQRYRLQGIAQRTDWRAVRDFHRILIGAIFLTHAHATVGRVAKALGYAAPSALCHAFANVGLPPPATIRQRVRA